MLISLDYDDTFTRDPDFWAQVVALGKLRGHSFVCVTARSSPPADDESPIPMPIVCAGNEWKATAAARAGFLVHVWIDDMPQLIKPEARLSFHEDPTDSQLDKMREIAIAGLGVDDTFRELWNYVKGHA